MVGVTQQTVSGLIGRGVLKPGDSLRTWILGYATHMRSVAAGCGGDQSGELTAARTREALRKTELLEIQIAREIKALLPAAEIEQDLQRLVVMARTKCDEAAARILDDVRARGVEIDDDVVTGPIRSALMDLAAYRPCPGSDVVARDDGLAPAGSGVDA